MYKKGDKVIILDYSGKPLDPAVVAEIEEVYGDDRVRLLLPDHACCMEFVDRFEKIDNEKYEEILHSEEKGRKPLQLIFSWISGSSLPNIQEEGKMRSSMYLIRTSTMCQS